MAGVTQEHSMALAPHGIVQSMTSNENGVGDLPGKHVIISIGVSRKSLSSIYTTRDFGSIAKDRRGQERL
jgi:hypothetical protein